MNIYFINKLIKKYNIDFNYAELIYLDLYSKGLIGEAYIDIDLFDDFKDFIKKYFKEK